MTVMSSFRALVNLRRSSTKAHPIRTSDDAFYPIQPSCQIPNLGFILSRFLGDRTDGFYVEIGGYDGLFASNTWGLAAKGWSGHLAEPVPELADRCRENYGKYPRIQVHETAISAPGMDRLTLRLAGTLTTASPQQAMEYSRIDWAASCVTSETLTVSAMSLDDFLESIEAPQGFDLLGIDVEGFEASVFAGFSIEHWRPRMLIVELADVHPELAVSAATDAELQEGIVAAGYRVAYKDSINTVFVRSDVALQAYAELRGSSTQELR